MGTYSKPCFLYYNYIFSLSELFHSYLIVAWLKGLFTSPHFTRHLWKANRDVNQCQSLPKPLLAKITFLNVTQVFSGRLHHHIWCTCLLHFFRSSGRAQVTGSFLLSAHLTASQVLFIQLFASVFLGASVKCFLINQWVTNLHSWPYHLIPCSENFLVFHFSDQFANAKVLWILDG